MGGVARSSDTEHRNTVYLGGENGASGFRFQFSVIFLRGGIIIIGRDTSKLVQMADGSFVRKRLE